MPEIIHQMYIDCGPLASRYRRRYPHMSEVDLHAILVAGVTRAVEQVYVDPILAPRALTAAGVSETDASVMAGGFNTEVAQCLDPHMSHLLDVLNEDQQITATSQVEEDMVVMITLTVGEDK